MQGVKFNIGDRVLVIRGSNWYERGDIGIVKELSIAPWVRILNRKTSIDFAIDQNCMVLLGIKYYKTLCVENQ
jgi:hypothetical protein